MFHFMNFVRPFVNYAIFHELCDGMRFEVDCAKSHHRVISEGLSITHCLSIFLFDKILNHFFGYGQICHECIHSLDTYDCCLSP